MLLWNLEEKRGCWRPNCVHTIDNTFPGRDKDRDTADSGGGLFATYGFLLRGIDYIPDLKNYLLVGERARIEARVALDQPTADYQPLNTPTWRVYTLQVFAQQSEQLSGSIGDYLASYQLNVDPNSRLGVALGKVLGPYVGVSRFRSSASRGDVETLLREIDEIVLKDPTAEWNVLSEAAPRWITEDDIERIAPHIRDASMLRVIPSFHEFVTNQLSTCAQFVSVKTTSLRHFTLITTLDPAAKQGQLELRTQDTSGKARTREFFRMPLEQPDSDAWLVRVRERVYNPGAEASVENSDASEKETMRQLLLQAVDAAVVFKNLGAAGIRKTYESSTVWGEQDQTTDTDPPMSERDEEIRSGHINQDTNLLSEHVEGRNFDYHSSEQEFVSPLPLVHLEVGDRVARVSVHASHRFGAPTCAWYLINETPFSMGDTSRLEQLWRAAEMLRSNSDGSIYQGIEQLNFIVERPSARGIIDPQAVLDFDVGSVRGIEFRPVTPVRTDQVARVVVGIEDIDAKVLSSHPAARYPGNFQAMRFSLHPDGALSMRGLNAFNGCFDAFIPASGFEDTRRTRSDVIKLLSKLMVWRPEDGRRHLQGAVAALAEGADGWFSCTRGDIADPGGAKDVPPVDLVGANVAYDYAARIAQSFSEIADINPSSIPITPVKIGSIRPASCFLTLREPKTRTILGMLIDDVGIRKVIVWPGTQHGAKDVESITFVTPSSDTSPFHSQQELRKLLTTFSQLKEDVKEDKDDTPHGVTAELPSVDFGNLLRDLSKQMRRIRYD